MESNCCRLQGEKGLESSNGLTNEEVSISRQEHGSNEVKAQQTPEWKKVSLECS